MPGGNTRATVYMKPHPFYAAHGRGCRLSPETAYLDSSVKGSADQALTCRLPPVGAQEWKECERSDCSRIFGPLMELQSSWPGWNPRAGSQSTSTALDGQHFLRCLPAPVRPVRHRSLLSEQSLVGRSQRWASTRPVSRARSLDPVSTLARRCGPSCSPAPRWRRCALGVA